MVRSEVRGLVRHAVNRIEIVRTVVGAAWRADRILGNARVHGLSRIEVADCDRRRGVVIVCKNPFDGFPKSATAATWSATTAGIGPVRPAGSAKPTGTESAVMYPITAAPCE